MAASQHLASREDILAWANQIPARHQLPEIVRRLIRETNDQILRLDMPSEEGTARHGYDGIVDAGRGTPFVPEGHTVWEMGTDKSPTRKAEADYKGRTADPLGEDKANTTFCFVTPRKFPNKRQWEKEKHTQGEWRSVRVYDIDDIWTALDTAVATHVRLSEFADRSASGVMSLQNWWERFARQSSPPLTPRMVLLERADSAADLLSILDRDTAHTVVRGASVDDVLAFVAATILSADADLGQQLLDRALVVLESSALMHLETHATLLILLPFNESMYREARLLTSHHVIYLAEGNVPSDLGLPPIDPRAFSQLLVEAGVGVERADALGEAAATSLVAYQHLAPAVGSVRHPSWRDQFGTTPRRRSWLAGAWTGSRSADQACLEGLSGISYQDLETELADALQDPDPAFSRVGQTWSIVARLESWHYVASGLTSADLESLEEAVQTVLGAVDPALSLPVAERWTAGVRGLQRIHSSDLRKSIAQGMALIGSRGEALSLGHGQTGSQRIDGVVFNLLLRANSDPSADLWASLADVLPQLAEASPSVFLRAVADALTGESPLFERLFTDKADTHILLSGSSPHASVLWALESLAWSQEHFGLSVESLARLAELDPGGRLSNRPAATLTDIFRPWDPQTSASPEARNAALDWLARRHESVTWSLLLSLLPEQGAVGGYTHKPEFRDWIPAPGPTITFGELWRLQDSVVDRLLALLQKEPAGWPQLLKKIDHLTPTQRNVVLDGVTSTLVSGGLADEVRIACWDVLDSLIRRHLAFSQAEWALNAEQLGEVSRVSEILAPEAPDDRHRWLFDDGMPDLPDRREMAFDEFQRELERQRGEAAKEILAFGGMDLIRELAAAVGYPDSLGWALAGVDVDLIEDMVALLDSNNPKFVRLASAYFARKSEREPQWLAQVADESANTVTAKARLLLCSEPSASSWQILEQLGQEVADAYWREFQPNGLGADFPHVAVAARQLLRVGRPHVALDLLAIYRGGPAPIDPQLIVDAFNALFDEGEEVVRQLRGYDVEELLKALRDGEVGRDVVAELEWKLLPLVGFDSPSPTLEHRMATSGAFFVEVLSLAFRAETGDEEPTEDSRVAAQLAFRLLREFKTVPGSSGRLETIDDEGLRDWIAEVRSEARNKDRGGIAEAYIGHVLAHSRADDDGTWPSLPVRNVIESSASTTLENGFSTETFNKRGLTSRGPDEGGRQEYELATKFKTWAAAVRNSAPRTAAVLQALADGYDADGRAQDERVALRRKGLGW
jgi:hypothetical protein